jgi:hypothetical protein
MGELSAELQAAGRGRASRDLVRLAVAIPSAVLLCACGIGVPTTPSYVAQSATDLVVVDYPPPPARAESVPPKPARGAVWIDGEWSARDHKWGWVAGRWVMPPKGAKFSPWTVVRGKDGTLYFARGVWRDASGRPIPPPPPLATAGVESAGVVIDPEGEAEETGPTLRRAGPPKP